MMSQHSRHHAQLASCLAHLDPASNLPSFGLLESSPEICYTVSQHQNFTGQAWVKLEDIKQRFHDFSIELGDYSVFVTECTYENKTQAVRNQTCPSANLSYVLSEVAPGSLTAGCDQHLSAQDGKHSLNPALPGHTNICLFVVMVSQWTSSSARCSPLSQQALGRARSTYTCSTDSYAGQAHTHTHLSLE